MSLRHRRTGVATGVGAATVALAVVQVGSAVSASAAPAPFDTGFNPTNAGVVRFLPLAPREASPARPVNAPLGLRAAHRIALLLGFDRARTFSASQYRAYMSGQGRPPGYTAAEAQKAAQLTRLSVRYLGNTAGRTYTRVIDGERVTVSLGSYGLFVDRNGMLRVPANCPDPTSSDFASCSPVRLINWVLAPQAVCANPDRFGAPPPGVPCGYMGAWMRHNGATDTLRELYTSAYVREAPYASSSQEAAGASQLIYVNKADAGQQVVGVPVAPAMWFTNFLLIYALSPEEAATMPASWAAIPDEVVAALLATPAGSPTAGQVPYGDYLQYFTD